MLMIWCRTRLSCMKLATTCTLGPCSPCMWLGSVGAARLLLSLPVAVPVCPASVRPAMQPAAQPCGLTFSSIICCCCSGVCCMGGGICPGPGGMPPGGLLPGGGGIMPAPGGPGGKPPSIACAVPSSRGCSGARERKTVKMRSDVLRGVFLFVRCGRSSFHLALTRIKNI
jgi:hypothetical protein